MLSAKEFEDLVKNERWVDILKNTGSVSVDAKEFGRRLPYNFSLVRLKNWVLANRGFIGLALFGLGESLTIEYEKGYYNEKASRRVPPKFVLTDLKHKVGSK